MIQARKQLVKRSFSLEYFKEMLKLINNPGLEVVGI